MGASSCSVEGKMKVLVLLSVLGLALAQEINHPAQQLLQPLPLTTLMPTIKTSDTGVISTYTATFPYNGIPFIHGAMPYTFGHPFMQYPTLIAAKPAESRQKRSADPEPAINFPKIGDVRLAMASAAEKPAVATIQTPAAVATIPAATPIQYTGFPTYTVPAQTTIAHTGLNPVVGYPYSGLTWSGMSPYTTFPWFQTPMTTTNIVKPIIEGSRTKRSAEPEPEADPQFLTTAGIPGFTYPAVNTGTLRNAYTYQNLPMTYSNIPTTYTTGFPYNYGGFPAVTAVMG